MYFVNDDDEFNLKWSKFVFLIYREWRNFYIFFNLFNLNRVYHFKEIVIQMCRIWFYNSFFLFFGCCCGKNIFSLELFSHLWWCTWVGCSMPIERFESDKKSYANSNWIGKLNTEKNYYIIQINVSCRFGCKFELKKQPCDIRHFIWLHSLKWIRQMPFRVFALNFFSSAISLNYLASGRNNSWCQFKKTIIKFAVIWIYSTESNTQTCHLKCTSKWKMTCPKAKTHAK